MLESSSKEPRLASERVSKNWENNGMWQRLRPLRKPSPSTCQRRSGTCAAFEGVRCRICCIMRRSRRDVDLHWDHALYHASQWELDAEKWGLFSSITGGIRWCTACFPRSRGVPKESGWHESATLWGVGKTTLSTKSDEKVLCFIAFRVLSLSWAVGGGI